MKLSFFFFLLYLTVIHIFFNLANYDAQIDKSMNKLNIFEQLIRIIQHISTCRYLSSEFSVVT
jgi:hypothetical protein